MLGRWACRCTRRTFSRAQASSDGSSSVSLVISSQVAVVGSDYVLAWLTTAGLERETDPTSSVPSQNSYLLLYLYFVLASTVLLAARSLYLAYICTKAGAVLHRRLFFGLLRAPQWFHESTPSGRVLNRVGKDQDMVDSQLPGVIQDIFACSVSVAGTICLTIFVTPLSIPALALIFGMSPHRRTTRPSTLHCSCVGCSHLCCVVALCLCAKVFANSALVSTRVCCFEATGVGDP